jgi:hypothetical protein
MTEEHIKETLSRHFTGILAANVGFSISKPEMDYGIDCRVEKVVSYTHPQTGKARNLGNGNYIDIQLKATTEDQIIPQGNLVKYDLEVKTYNDLVTRMNDGQAPLVLIVFILPSNRNAWVQINPNELRFRKHAYWYQPGSGAALSSNVSTVRIDLLSANMLDINSFQSLYTAMYP